MGILPSVSSAGGHLQPRRCSVGSSRLLKRLVHSAADSLGHAVAVIERDDILAELLLGLQRMRLGRVDQARAMSAARAVGQQLNHSCMMSSGMLITLANTS